MGPTSSCSRVDQLRERLGETHNTFETQCGAWAAFKLAKYLVCFTGDARYGDWIERLALNGIGASLPMTRDGRVFYYSDYCLYGATKRLTDFGWSCCTGTRPQAVADYADLVYFHDADTLHVNLFTPSTVKWTVHGKVVTVAQTTTFPETDEVRFVVSLEDPVEFGINVRVPGWLAAPMVASVNGSAADLRFDGRHWAGLRRTWRTGDVILAKLPMKLWRSSFDPRHSRPAARALGRAALRAGSGAHGGDRGTCCPCRDRDGEGAGRSGAGGEAAGRPGRGRPRSLEPCPHRAASGAARP